MSQAMFSGVSGLIAHQRKLDIVANNLANMNTTAFKSANILFNDLMYNTLQTATTGDNFYVGGRNPVQSGFGVKVSQTTRNHRQGVLNPTGNIFDFALEGPGFFVTDNGVRNYTRNGAFSMDSLGFLVDPVNGAYVQRFGITGEGDSNNPAFQVSSDNRIRIPLGASVSGSRTTEASFFGNLPVSAKPPAAEILASNQPYLTGGSPATATTLLNDLDTIITPFAPGDQLHLTGRDFYGNSIDAFLTISSTTTLGDIVNFYNSHIVDAVASIDSEGRILVTADQTGESAHRLELAGVTGNTGNMNYMAHSFLEQVKGKGPDVVDTTIQIFDSRGEPHVLSVQFQKMGINTWDANFTLIDDSGNMIDGRVGEIEFDEEGNFISVRGVGVDNSQIVIDFNSLLNSQTINIDFAKLSHRATAFSAAVNQDGFPPGNIVSIGVTSDGLLEGIANNGTRVPVARLAIANFSNALGLEAVGDSNFRETAASGNAQVSGATAGGIGSVRNGHLESSNVDVAIEFTQLIVAQRGFSANARSITVASEMLQELTNIVR
ncbi:MAG TPA: flagellar hook-basal body complex protein [Pirellulaceae bacterium]|nr:flagellar hook-basal body complex protein [Pirellulaceae bacterium]HMO91551.1 flagellar hook-basal body complex protein [Pirellulaceae bacterium]HMP68248.1 flagellar hook-basal body complex protein [Pirellulaceae bacterium]